MSDLLTSKARQVISVFSPEKTAAVTAAASSDAPTAESLVRPAAAANSVAKTVAGGDSLFFLGGAVVLGGLVWFSLKHGGSRKHNW